MIILVSVFAPERKMNNPLTCPITFVDNMYQYLHTFIGNCHVLENLLRSFDPRKDIQLPSSQITCYKEYHLWP